MMNLTWEGVSYSADELANEAKQIGLVRNNKGVKYYNVSMAFDIESSSFYVEGNKEACMYVWMFGVNGKVHIGRTWEDWTKFIYEFSKALYLGEKKKCIVYVHNLSFDFQFFSRWINIEKVFALDKHKPLYADSFSGIEFRCSYLLSGLSLEKVGQDLTKYRVNKKVGDLDYNLLRGPQTPLTPKEIGYCVYDVIVLCAYIQECIEKDGNITKIPLTATGYMREYCRKSCLYINGDHKKLNQGYRRLMENLTVEPEEYKQLKKTFQGGFTHANPLRSGKTFRKVRSHDFTSSYPAVMVYEQFPMSKGKKVGVSSLSELKHYLKYYCCMFKAKFFRLTGKQPYEHIVSASRCVIKGNRRLDNGRIVEADEVMMYLTDVDFENICFFYDWENLKVMDLWIYERGYLPVEFVKAILNLYVDKTKLKGVKGKEEEYQKSKGLLNAGYGCTVTDIVRDMIEYLDGEWTSKPTDTEEAIGKYNKNKRRFLFYPWGIWITAYARRNLFSAIKELGMDYIYSDTDSVKFTNYEAHKEYFERFNQWVMMKLKKAMKFHGLDMEMCAPKTIKGKTKPLGVWDDEGEYLAFKTLGAKRYIVRKKDSESLATKIEITVAGLGKKIACKYLVNRYGYYGVFSAFKFGLKIPAEFTGKLTHTYSEAKDYEGEFIDYLGNKCYYAEKGWVHLEEQPYDLKASDDYLDYLKLLEGYTDEVIS